MEVTPRVVFDESPTEYKNQVIIEAASTSLKTSTPLSITNKLLIWGPREEVENDDDHQVHEKESAQLKIPHCSKLVINQGGTTPVKDPSTATVHATDKATHQKPTPALENHMVPPPTDQSSTDELTADPVPTS